MHSRRDDEVAGRWLRPLCVAALLSVVTYLQLAVSQEFSPFAPVSVDLPVYFVAAALAGMTAFWMTERLGGLSGMTVLALLIVVPVFFYAGLSLALSLAVSGSTALLDLFILQVGQRAVIYVLMAGPLKGVGMLLGMIVLRLYRH